MSLPGTDLILKYFPELTAAQIQCLDALELLYRQWNAKVNVISRKDIDNLYEHHVLHSLAIAKFIRFKPDTRVLDVGTGGGFPGLPLAILMPDVRFTLLDSIRKKIQVVGSISEELHLSNINVIWQRAEEFQGTTDFVVSRAVAPVANLLRMTNGKINKHSSNNIPNGLICLKGGTAEEELIGLHCHVNVHNISKYYTEPFFEGKKIFYITCC